MRVYRYLLKILILIIFILSIFLELILKIVCWRRQFINKCAKMINLKKIRHYSLVIRISSVTLVTVIFLGLSIFKSKQSAITSSFINDDEYYHNRKILMMAETINQEMNAKLHQTQFFLYITESVERLLEVSNVFRKPDSKINCTPRAIYEFPSDGLTKDQRQMGWIVFHLIISIYCFWLLAIACGDYFIPSIEDMCRSNLINILIR